METHNNEEEFEITEDTENEVEDDIEMVEEQMSGKLKDLRNKLKECEKEKMTHLEALQRAKADFLNSKRRLEEERNRDSIRLSNQHIDTLLPLCDSFHMAMSDEEKWNAVDKTWRVGIESIFNQLQTILSDYNVSEIRPQGETFDPKKHEAMANVAVEDAAMEGKVVSVIQLGYERKVGNDMELIRPARVTVGELHKK